MAADDSKFIALARQAPQGRLFTPADGTLVARDGGAEVQWSLNALAQAAKEACFAAKRPQVRAILCAGGVRWAEQAIEASATRTGVTWQPAN